MSATANPEELLPDIDGVPQLDQPPDGSRAFTRVYYRDAAEQLTTDIRAVPAREKHCIAPRVGWPKRIYRLPS